MTAQASSSSSSDRKDSSPSAGRSGLFYLTSTTSVLFVALAALFYQRGGGGGGPWTEPEPRLRPVLHSLLRQERSSAGWVTPDRTKIAVGYGVCQDLDVTADAFFDTAERMPPEPEYFPEVEDWAQFRKMFTYFFQHGAAAERYIANHVLFDELVARGKKSRKHRTSMGGNAATMAARFALEGADVLLAAKMTPGLQTLLPPGVTLVGSENVEKDDVHIVIEYKRGETWGKYRAPRDNRFIVHSDTNNPTLSSLEPFGQALASFSPNLLLIGGLQMMDNFPFASGQRLERLLKVQSQMAAQSPERTRIHFEMASFADASLLQELAEHVIPYADSLGMNEQELPNLYSMLQYGNVSLVSDSNPRIATMLDQSRAVFRILSQNSGSVIGSRPLTRLHIHTLAYQAIIVRKGSAWKNTRLAAAKASLMANRHVCASKWVDLDKAFLLMDDSFSTSAENKKSSRRIAFDEERPVACWTESMDADADDLTLEVCVAPNLVCADAKQTGGGGDNISAAGLVLQV